jgi:hypothetical protein
VSHIRPDSPFLADFVAFHLVDIHRFQPDFHLPTGDDVVTLLLNRDGLPAGLLIGRRHGDRRSRSTSTTSSARTATRALGRWLYGPGAEVFRPTGSTSCAARAPPTPTASTWSASASAESPTDPDLYELTL